MVRVSVLMPVYRTNEEYLREAISSILAQTYSDFEFLILDDCPEDDRELIVKSYKDRRIKYLRNETNMGISESRNKLVDMARGEYLAVMDHDDVSLPERLEKQMLILMLALLGVGQMFFLIIKGYIFLQMTLKSSL